MNDNSSRSALRHRLAVIGLVVFIVIELIVMTVLLLTQDDAGTDKQKDTQTAGQADDIAADPPKLKTEILYGNRSHIWEIAFVPTGEMLFNERKGLLHTIANGQVRQVADLREVSANGEGGLMGLAIDPEFADNRYIYMCYNSTAGDIRVSRWVLDSKITTLTQKTDIITGIPANPSGRHSGCRLAFGPEDFLWVGTGDTAQDLTPQPAQDPQSLGGKILRVDRDGKAAPGNVGGAFDSRVYSYGHRNVQGLAFFPVTRGGVVGLSAEHGPDTDDELNRLSAGNFGWAPPDGNYFEGVPMTDTDKFPNAIPALWRSGTPTQAPAGITILNGPQWGAWDGAVAMAMLKEQHLKILTLDDNLKITSEDEVLKSAFGRLRTVVQGPDGSLYVGSSNGTDDRIIRITAE